MRHNPSPFKWRHYAPDVILLCVGWYYTAERAIEGIEAMHVMRKGQVMTSRGVRPIRAAFRALLRSYAELFGTIVVRRLQKSKR